MSETCPRCTRPLLKDGTCHSYDCEEIKQLEAENARLRDKANRLAEAVQVVIDSYDKFVDIPNFNPVSDIEQEMRDALQAYQEVV